MAQTPEDRMKIPTIVAWAMMAVPTLISHYINHDLVSWGVFLSTTAALCLLLLGSRMTSIETRQYVLSFVLVAQSILTTTALTGHPWQLDSHMLFFATLAIISTIGSPIALLFSAALVAVHHLSFTFVFPLMVYPEATVMENIIRTAIHAVVVVAETIALLLSLNQRLKGDKAVEKNRVALAAQMRESEEAHAVAVQAHEEAEEFVKAFAVHLERLAGGDLDCEITADFPENFARMRSDFNMLLDSLNAGLGTAVESSAGFVGKAKTLSASAQDLSERAETQSTVLCNTTGDLRDLSVMVDKGATDSSTARDKAQIASKGAMENGDLMADAVRAMKQIQESSDAVAAIINVIEDIAFQTNLLALNASIEAARAGEAGRGFAVVATEVRVLAQRTSEAANKVRELISTSGEQVRDGADIVDRASSALLEISQFITATSDLITVISNANRKQASSLVDITQSLANLNDATQHNAVMAEELTALSAEMDGEAQVLGCALEIYTIRERTRTQEEWQDSESAAA